MGVQPRAYSMPNNEAAKSPSLNTATSPVTRKRRYMDVVLVGDETQDDAEQERELAQRVSFKRSKSGEKALRVRVTGDAETARDSESLEPITPTALSGDAPLLFDKTSSSDRTPARPNMSASQTITLDMLRPHFEKPLAQVAQVFGICVTLLKKICRKNGLARWPHRQIIGLRKSIASMEQAIGHFEGARRDSYAQQLEKQRNKLTALLEDPTKCNLLAVEDEYIPAHPTSAPAAMPTRSPAIATQMPSQPPYYSTYHAMSAPAPVYEGASYMEYWHTPPPPVPHHVAYMPHHQHYSTSYGSGYHPHAPPPMQAAMLPPLRTDARQALPSLSALVGRRW